MSNTKTILSFTDLVSCGTPTSCTVVAPVVMRRCFTFKTIRESWEDIIINKQEWEAFMKFAGMIKKDKPCNQN